MGIVCEGVHTFSNMLFIRFIGTTGSFHNAQGYLIASNEMKYEAVSVSTSGQPRQFSFPVPFIPEKHPLVNQPPCCADTYRHRFKKKMFELALIANALDLQPSSPDT